MSYKKTKVFSFSANPPIFLFSLLTFDFRLFKKKENIVYTVFIYIFDKKNDRKDDILLIKHKLYHNLRVIDVAYQLYLDDDKNK